jgi:5-hydroxyisourate hydrolase
MTHITTHVLDATRGAPAVSVAVALARHVAGGGTEQVGEGLTDADGRLSLGPESLEPGMYQLSFGTGAYFADQGTETFYPLVVVTFTVAPGSTHYHVPLLLSPFAYSTYRGS